MRILLKTVLDCDPDTAWRAIRSPAVLQAVSAPWMGFESREEGGFPEEWPTGEHVVCVKAFGIVPIADQVIGISFPQRRDGVRMMRDNGRGLVGAFAPMRRWQHSLTVAAAPGGRTLYRDQLIIEAGVLTPLFWAGTWAFWQWRAARMRALAPTWASRPSVPDRLSPSSPSQPDLPGQPSPSQPSA